MQRNIQCNTSSPATSDTVRKFSVHKLSPAQSLFTPGYIFGKLSSSQMNNSRLQYFIQTDLQTRESGTKFTSKRSDNGHEVWGAWETRLEGYGRILYPGISKAKELALDALSNGGAFADFGIGGGGHWMDFFEQASLDPQKVNFFGTALTNTFDPRLNSENIFLCDVARIPEHLNANSLDLALSNFGMHDQELIGIEAALHLLKRGGEAIITAQGHISYDVLIPNITKFCKLIAYSLPTDRSSFWGVHLRKH